MSSFVRAASASAIPPGRGRCVEVAGRRIAVWNAGGTFYAIDDDCPHAGGPLSEGDLEGALVICPWHGAAFDLATGACREGPSDEDVATYPVRVVGDDVEIEV